MAPCKAASFELGYEVAWNACGKKCTWAKYERFGTITEVVPANTKPISYRDGYYETKTRDHESYVVTSYPLSKRGKVRKPKRYWPLVTRLRIVTAAPPAPLSVSTTEER